MKSIKYIIIAAVILMTTLACSISVPDIRFEIISGNGNVTEESRDVSGFDKVELNGVGDLVIQQGDTEGLTIKGEENLLSHIETKVVNDTLIIEVKRGYTLTPTRELEYSLSVKDLTSVQINGLGEVSMNGLETSDLQLDVRGSGNLDFTNLVADTLSVYIAGLGDVTTSGEVTSQVVTISGSGNYKGQDLESSTADVTISGLGSASIRVSDDLKAEIAGAGSIEYIGSPNVNQVVNGLGSVKQLDE